MATAPEFRTKILTRGSRPDDYAVYRAGLEWDLTDPIVIESEQDFKAALTRGECHFRTSLGST